ncbi:ABC transporter ATP-binding protein [Granulosicoccus antarcticus]|uniref:sn-glycerol-3-phosphate import ATP-binding protein UgpC n=1 Tax=Granulosicoccus antarcticus IMCC3135 TaxID=1192854 RepID=A0A2Z2P492_9GAMM|nr:sn-glycerol-3-phosphate ABC transporter ATP-binding protein UgpC [Granulosicoccus antarcticus]ASJ75487.1 sn-glycerol-3-phosphate import ATP-binding protein UgpC [Granulosicoccus antarcticus IMCC3135]
MASLALRDLVKRYGKTQVLHGINLEVEDGEFIVFVGPSGCGKSTTLRMIAGLEEVSSGSIEINGAQVNNLEPKQRNIAMVFQNYAIYPHMSVRKNIGFGLRTAKLSKSEKAARIVEVAALLGMEDYLDRKPGALSGGQRQRVAIGRALVRDPAVFLFDEPLSNLDAQLRTQMRLEIKKLHQRVGTTIVFVTHDQVEAMTMADRIVIMKDGHIQQVGTPAEAYHNPVNTFVAQFIGAPSMNMLPGSLDEQGLTLWNGTRVPWNVASTEHSHDVILGIRPEDLIPVDESEAMLSGVITVVEPLGSETLLYVEVDGMEFIASGPGRQAPEPGSRLFLGAAAETMHLFDKDSGVALR